MESEYIKKVKKEQTEVHNLIKQFIDGLKQTLNLEKYSLKITIDPFNTKTEQFEEAFAIARTPKPNGFIYFYNGNIILTDNKQ
jgi:hypothetical protein